MSKRLQVLMADDEMAEIERLAAHERMSVGEWVRRALHEVRTNRSSKDPEQKVRAVREAAKHSFPTADIEQMNAEIERGYSA